MYMAELKTKVNDASVSEFINNIENPQRKKDSIIVNKLFKKITGSQPKMWGSSIVGYGTFPYKRKDGTEYEWMTTGFSPRKTSLTLYIMPGFDLGGEFKKNLENLGKYKTGKSCLYINKLDDVDINVLEKLINLGYQYMVKKYDLK